MYAIDFEYDGQLLSEYNCIICDFDGASGAVFASAGSSITFNKVTRNFGRSNSLAGIQYDECITATFDICKDPDNIEYDEDKYFSSVEYRAIMRWLNRGSFNKFYVIYEHEDVDVSFYNASFNVEKIKIGERVCGLRLTMETDRPYAYGEEQKYNFSISGSNLDEGFTVTDISDDIGDTSPIMRITCTESGDLYIENSTMGLTTIILNCSQNEEIIIDGNTMTIKTNANNNIWDRFNYVFPQITNSIDNRDNEFRFSMPCNVVITYTPIIKETL